MKCLSLLLQYQITLKESDLLKMSFHNLGL